MRASGFQGFGGLGVSDNAASPGVVPSGASCAVDEFHWEMMLPGILWNASKRIIHGVGRMTWNFVSRFQDCCRRILLLLTDRVDATPAGLRCPDRENEGASSSRCQPPQSCSLLTWAVLTIF